MSVGHDERGRIQGVTREALNRLLEQARTYGRKPEAIERADEFLLFKLWAAAHAREEIIRTIQSGVTSFRYVPESLQSDFRVGPITAENRFLPGLDFLHLWMDAYLLELIGVPDALAQLANVVFDLGLPVTDLGMLNNADTKLAARLLRVGGSLPTGLEEWKSKKTAWLDDLREVRNQATHRHLVRLVEIKPWDQQPPPPGPGKWTSDVVIDVRPGDSRPLIDFVAKNYDAVLGLLKSSLDRLLVVLKLVGR